MSDEKRKADTDVVDVGFVETKAVTKIPRSPNLTPEEGVFEVSPDAAHTAHAISEFRLPIGAPAQAPPSPRNDFAAPRGWAPAMVQLGGDLLEHSPQLTRMRFAVDSRFADTFGTLQSGILVAFFDIVMDACIAAQGSNRRFATLESSARFFRALKGGHVIVDAAVLRAGRTTITVECLAWDAASELCAKGTATKMYVG